MRKYLQEFDPINNANPGPRSLFQQQENNPFEMILEKDRSARIVTQNSQQKTSSE